MIEVRLTPRADLDIAEILSYLDLESTTLGPAFLDRLDEAVDLIRRYPQIGHHRLELGNSEYRFYSMHPYLLPYRSFGDTLFVVRILHMARDIAAELNTEPSE